MNRRIPPGLGAALASSALALMGGCGGTKTPKPIVSAAIDGVVSPAAAKRGAAKPAAPSFVVRPASAKMEPGDPGIQLLAESRGPHGGRVDRTGRVSWKSEPEGIVRIGRDER